MIAFVMTSMMMVAVMLFVMILVILRHGAAECADGDYPNQ